MDSFTQILLGASVGTAVLYREVGWRAVFWGGLGGLFPDLDIFIPFGDAVRNFTYHRGFSHSIFVLAAVTPLFAGLILRLHPSTAPYRRQWLALVFLVLITHILLDCLTVYGTQILWPFKTPPVMWSTLFIIDPAYSLLLLTGILAVLLCANKRSGFKINAACLILSTLYIFWSIGAKIHVTGVARANIDRQQISHQKLLTVPAPFNTLLWRILIIGAHDYYEGFYCLLDPTPAVDLRRYPRNPDLLRGIQDHWPVKRLQWFTHGFYALRQDRQDIVLADLRMGLEPDYVFQFKVGEQANPHARPAPNRRVRSDPSWDKLPWLWQRIWDPGAVSPEGP